MAMGILGLAYKPEKFKPWRIHIMDWYRGEFFKISNGVFTFLLIVIKKRTKLRYSSKKIES
ncbi:hypothetical protein C0W92_03700 [Photobacterium angustum]|uniref:Uncharacterized protein n=1 Tax=Photobacterium angustum TaxID=661 RepID=A0A855SCB3_PHOAN|nr:hypothetical protein C0W92_03700 [Photobacterium angustum]PSX05510.1 hypothetical protein C0W41_17890 [Photobacterium angustum]PSX14250.1 hypothetical protein C0W55_14430 [Photobacterium angustum]PSX22764.1 hypothetical protein C0W36_12040 [Photobacterium angustum]PSX39728.1 hypothetical protein C0W34_17120 [Photobacterium angustum]